VLDWGRCVVSRWIKVFALCASLGPRPVGAADESGLQGLVDEALAGNPEVKAAEQVLRAARQRPAQAGALADPMLSVNYVNEGWSPSLGRMQDSSLGVMVSQDLPFPGKRGLRASVALQEADQVQQQVARVRLRLAADVKRAYFAVVESRELRVLTEEQRGLWMQIEGVARARYAVGEASQQDVLRAQIELTKLEQALTAQDAEAGTRVAALNRLLGRPMEMELTTPSVVQAVVEVPERSTALSRALERSPERASARIGVNRAQTAIDLARRSYKPDFVVQAGYMNRGSFDPMWQAGVAINLPLVRGRIRAGVSEAEALRIAEEAQLSAVELQLRLRTQERVVQLEAAVKMLRIYDTGLIPQDRLSVDSALASYRTGRVPFLTVLDALTTLYSDRAALTRLRTAQARLGIALEEASLDPTSEISPGLPAVAGMTTAATASGGSMGGSMAGR
jgi:outer membrane protein TolC